MPTIKSHIRSMMPMPLPEIIKSIAGACLDSGETLFGLAQAASAASITVGAGAVLATAWFDHVGLDVVISDPSRLQPCLTIAAAAAILRGLIYMARFESMVGRIVGVECITSSAAATPIYPRTSSPPSRRA
jgi:hypothetical protein